MDNRLRDAFITMTADADPMRVTEAVTARRNEKTETSRKLPSKRVLRTVIAAAAVLALSVTVYAVVAGHLTVLVPENGDYDYLVKVTDGSGGEAKIAKDALQELEALAMTQEDIQSGSIPEKTFATWAEAAEWLNCGLLVSDLLVEQEAVTLRAFADGDGELTTLSLYGSFSISGTEKSCSVMVNIPREHWGERYDLVVGYGENPNPSETTETIAYTTAAGFPVQIVEESALFRTEDGSTVRKYKPTLHLYHGGILYSIHGRYDTESQMDLAYMLADSLR